MLNSLQAVMPAFTLSAFLLFTFPVFAADKDPSLIDITNTDIDALLKMKITSVSKKSEAFSDADAAIFVLTSDDIRRSGATSIPGALRYVPGVQVARIDANKWAVSIRGFNSRTANKLLVLLDGRSIYDPLFSGVLWETKDVMLEDVDRIEIIRGPGGTLWGANAVNGVINIITKSAKETQGGLVTGGGGSDERGFGSARYGLKLSDDEFLRVYSKFLNRDSGYLPEGADDSSNLGRGGFRYDNSLNKNDALTVQGDFYQGTQGTTDESRVADTDTSGGNVLARWTRDLENEGHLSLQSYYDHTEFDSPALGELRNKYDIEFQHQLSKMGSHCVLWGLGYRYTSDDINNTSSLTLDPDNRGNNIISPFIQDEIELLTEKLYLTIGSKFEYNDYTGVEIQPSARLRWMTSPDTTYWTSVSRAVRIPSRLEEDLFIALPNGTVFTGSRSLDSETLIAYEAGVRTEVGEDTLLDFTTFINDYDKLVSVEGLTLGNKMTGHTLGAEAALTYIPRPDWRITTGYSFLYMDLKLDTDSLANRETTVSGIEGNNPEHQVFVRSGFDFYKYYEFDMGIRYVDALAANDVSSYTVADIRMGAKVSKNVELSIVGQNLFDNHHFEQGSGQVSQVRQGVYVKALVQF